MGYHFSTNLIVLMKKKSTCIHPKHVPKIPVIIIAFIINIVKLRESSQFFSHCIFFSNITLIDVLNINDYLLHRPEEWHQKEQIGNEFHKKTSVINYTVTSR